MVRWIKSLFAWKHVRDMGCYSYFENGVTGRRKAVRNTGGHSPIDMAWLLAGYGMSTIDGIPAWRSRHRNELPSGMFWG